MATVPHDPSEPETFADLLERLGDLPPERILLKPPPGTATEDDVLRALEAPRKRICELIDGVLVEKPMGAPESLLAAILLHFIYSYLDEHDLGLLLSPDGMLRLFPGQLRSPDITFLSWERLPEGRLPEAAIPALAPDLAVEVISPGNTKKEMQRKLRDYFLAGVREVWLIYPKTQTAEVYTAPDVKRRVPKTGALDGGTLLPGFRLPLAELFARTQRRSS